MNHLTVSQLYAAKVSVQAAIHDMQGLEQLLHQTLAEQNMDDKEMYLMDDAFASMDNAMGFLDDLVKAAQKESTLIKDNKTLGALYKEYELVRDLIGSEV